MKYFRLSILFLVLSPVAFSDSSESETNFETPLDEIRIEQAYDQKILLKQGELEIEKMRLKEKSKNEARRGR